MYMSGTACICTDCRPHNWGSIVLAVTITTPRCTRVALLTLHILKRRGVPPATLLHTSHKGLQVDTQPNLFQARLLRSSCLSPSLGGPIHEISTGKVEGNTCNFSPAIYRRNSSQDQISRGGIHLLTYPTHKTKSSNTRKVEYA